MMATENTDEQRSLRLLPPVYAPSLVYTCGMKFHDQIFCMLSDGSSHSRSVPEMRGMLCVRSCHGWLLLKSYYSGECRLFNPSTLSKINLPDLVNRSYNIGLLTFSPSDPGCIVMFFSEVEKSCIFCRIGDTKWNKQNILSKKNTSNIVIERYKTAVSANGKIFLFFHRGMAVIDVKDNFISTRAYIMKRLESSIPGIIITAHQFVEACGEIYLVVSIYLELSRVVQKFDVFKLNPATMAWAKVGSLGDKVFLLNGDATGVSVSASELGIKENRILFFEHDWTTLFSFFMEDETITASGTCLTPIYQYRGRFWVVPNCKPPLQMIKELAKKTEKDENNGKINCGDIPTELLELIVKALSPSDYLRFRLTCKFWISITPPVRSILPQTNSDSQHLLPWFIFFPGNKKSVCSINHPVYTDSYIMDIPQLSGAIIRHTKFGWFLMSKENLLFFFHPFTMDIVEIPKNGEIYTFECISFTSPPTSTDCVVCVQLGYIKDAVELAVYRKGEDSWRTHLIDVSYEYFPSVCNPIFYNGGFYYLAKDGKLGVFDPNETEEERKWKIVSEVFIPEGKPSSLADLEQKSPSTFLMECDGEIFAVFVGFMGSSVRVYQLDQSKELMEWVEVDNLGEKVIFISHTTSIMKPAVLKGTENRIYFPRLKGNESLFYSLSSGKYHSFGGKHSCEDWTYTWGHWNCTWFQPSD